MSAQANKEIVRRFVNEYQTGGRVETAHELLADNFIDRSALPGFSPDRQGVINLFTVLRNAFGDFRAEIQDQIAEEDKVTTRKIFYGTHTGEFMGIPATNRPVEIGVIDILRISNGQIAEHWCQVDVAGLMRQIGSK